MPLATNQQIFNRKVQQSIKDASKKAFLKTFEPNDLRDKDEIAEKMSTDFSVEFCKCSVDITTAITDHVLEATIVYLLANGYGPVTGTIEVT